MCLISYFSLQAKKHKNATSASTVGTKVLISGSYDLQSALDKEIKGEPRTIECSLLLPTRTYLARYLSLLLLLINAIQSRGIGWVGEKKGKV